MINKSQELNASEVSAEPVSTYLWISFAICFLGNASSGLISTLMSNYLPVVVKTLANGMSDEDLGRISAYINALYLVGWAIGGFTWGYISDRIGRARSLMLSLLGLGLSTLLISLLQQWELVVVLRILSGFSVGGILVLTPTLLSEIWPARTRSIMIGIDSIGFPVGIFSSGIITSAGSDWRTAFQIGVLPLVLGIFSIWILKESDNWKLTRNTVVSNSKYSHEDRQNLIMGSIIFSSMLIGLWGMFSWIPTWVQSLLVGSDGQTERGLSMMLLGGGGLFGGFISGWVSNSLGVRRSMMICFSGCVVMSVLLFGMNRTFSTIIYPELAILSVFFGISQGLLSVFIPQLFPFHIRGTATGFAFNIGRFVTAAAVFFIGILVSTFGGYGNTLLAFTSVFVIGFITIFFSSRKVQNLS